MGPRVAGTAPRRTRRRWVSAVGLLAVAALLVTGCAAGPNPDAGPAGAGFWLGLWHGLILPVTFIVSLFNDDVSIYEVANNGNWYDFGYCVGLSMFFSAGPAAGAANRRR
ncbi:hypothetical protein ATJ97_1863 [Georgenia soli]|uniref:Uncharacterized protein n=1 Tax=Georgenia soli TaxID=638953 RepID=A0A2A9EMA4_9MICO|nr:hypothetical protein [Georgenia soli]PFG39360.1 hypothetical protein ATJ97_1863 [Georgenia soli]